MPVLARSEDFRTGVVRFSYTDGLFKARAQEEGGVKKFGCTIMIPKADGKDMFTKAILQVSVEAWGEKAKQLLNDGLIKNPLLDGDGKQGLNAKTGERNKGMEDHWFIRATSGEGFQPKVVGKDPRIPITSSQEFYSGCYGKAIINAYAWEHPKSGKGVSFGITMAQFAADGERLGGGGPGNPEAMFDKIEDEGDAPASTRTGAGAGGMFD